MSQPNRSASHSGWNAIRRPIPETKERPLVVWDWHEQMVAEQAEREAALQKRYADLQRERAALTAS